MKLVYPVCFYEEEDDGYSIDVPDLPGCVTKGNNLSHALEMAVDAASGWILTTLEEGKKIPNPSNITDITLEYDNGITGGTKGISTCLNGSEYKIPLLNLMLKGVFYYAISLTLL